MRVPSFICLLCISIVFSGIFISSVEAQLPLLPSLWYEYISSYGTSFSFYGNYEFTTDLSTLETESEEFTNSKTTFYWTTFYLSFSGYWGDDYDTSDALNDIRDNLNEGTSGAEILSTSGSCLILLLSLIGLM